MGKLFDLESPLLSGLNKMADLIYLNLLTFVCCIPIITIGASMTALNYVVLKMVRNEDSHLTRQFFKSFKQNFKQATIIWLIILLAIIVLALRFHCGLRLRSWLWQSWGLSGLCIYFRFLPDLTTPPKIFLRILSSWEF